MGTVSIRALFALAPVPLTAPIIRIAAIALTSSGFATAAGVCRRGI
jgi:hypothetical protein